MHEKTTHTGSAKEPTKAPTTGAILNDQSVVELVFNRSDQQTQFAVGKDGSWELRDEVHHNDLTLVPYRPTNTLLRHSVILFPEEPQEYGTDNDLVADIAAYLNRYVDLTPRFVEIAAHYVLLSWVYDRFNELPYLRVRGDYGTGKTRFLVTLGSIMYKPIFASGASTVSPIFHMLDSFHGTLILDEADFRFSDETAEMVKILNNGNVRGFPILRTLVNDRKEYNPRAFHVFGPKVIATRGYYDDQALESRFITEEMRAGRVRKDIPINLPAKQKAEATTLRNKLLCYRYRNFAKAGVIDRPADNTVEGRVNQIMLPLLSVATNDTVRAELKAFAKARTADLKDERGMTVQAQLLEIIRVLLRTQSGSALTLKAISDAFRQRHGSDYEHRVTNRWIGSLLRKQLQLRPRKSHGIYVLPPEELSKLATLYDRFGIAETDADTDDTITWEPIQTPSIEYDSSDIEY